MPISTLLNPENILCHVQCQSRKRALQLAAQSIAENDPDRGGWVADEVFAGLVERERLGSTGLGFGVAIPHCRMACQSIHATFMSLEESVDYEALDNEGVDLLFVLVVPKNETHAHLDVLAELATVFSSAEHRSALRQCDNPDAILSCLQGIDAAAPDAKRA